MTMTGNINEPCNITVHKTFAQDVLVRRVRGEYREMPGLRLTLLQARRLWGVDVMTCSAALAALEASGFLATTREGAFVLADARMTA